MSDRSGGPPSPLRGGAGGGGADLAQGRADTPTPNPLPARGRGFLGACGALFATPALAHDGHHETLPLVEQVRHLLLQPDHLLAFAALAVLAVAGGWTWRRTTARK